MQDTILNGSGTSRSLKIPASKAVVYQDISAMVQDMVDGNFLFDIGPIRLSGVTQKGTDLNKSTLLTDATAALYGKDSSAVPDEIFSVLPEAIISNSAWKRTFVKFDTSTNWSPPETMLGDTVLVVAIGGGGGGGGGAGGYGGNGSGGGGGSGYIKIAEVKIDKNSIYPIQIGAGGAGGEAPTVAGDAYTDERNGKDGSPGGATSFGDLVIAAGGEGGHHGYFGYTSGNYAFGTGDGGAGGNGSSGGAGGKGAASPGGSSNMSGKGGNGIGTNGKAGTLAKGGDGGDGLSLLNYPQVFLPMLITDTTTELLGGSGATGGTGSGQGGLGGIGKIISGGAGGAGGNYGGGGDLGKSGKNGSPGVLYIFYQEVVAL